MEMKKKDLVRYCKDNNFYRTPELNEVLYFHYKGFCNIQEIDEYVNALCLWLEGNAIEKIENLDALVKLRQLYMQENCIRKIENLGHLTELVSLNLASNFIERIEGLSELTNLKTLNLKNNKLKSVDDISHVLEIPSLETLDLTGNRLNDPACIEVFAKMENLLSLYAHQNPFCNEVKPYRKQVVGKCSRLRYLDDRPVFDDERRTVNAYMKSGVEGERAERALIKQEEVARNEANRSAFRSMIEKAKAEAAADRAAGVPVLNTEFHDMNYTGPRSAEDEWYTREREKNKRVSEDVKRMEREAVGTAEFWQRPQPGATAAAAEEEKEEASPKTHQDPMAPLISDVDEEAEEEEEPDEEPGAQEDAAPAPGEEGLEEEDEGEEVRVRHTSSDLLPEQQQCHQPNRPMVWGTPQYDELWKRAVAAADDEEEEEGVTVQGGEDASEGQQKNAGLGPQDVDVDPALCLAMADGARKMKDAILDANNSSLDSPKAVEQEPGLETQSRMAELD